MNIFVFTLISKNGFFFLNFSPHLCFFRGGCFSAWYYCDTLLEHFVDNLTQFWNATTLVNWIFLMPLNNYVCKHVFTNECTLWMKKNEPP